MFARNVPLAPVGALVLLMTVLPAPAADFSQLVVFGDSLSDVGNVESITELLSPLVPPTPGPYYDHGRFSNGPNYVDRLSASLGLGASVQSTAGGTNYAYGGTMTTGTPFPQNVVVQDLDDQVTQYLTDTLNIADPTALYVVYVGANDVVSILGNNQGASEAAAAADRVTSQIDRLYDAGARQFLVPNLPLLGLIPRYSGDSTAAAAANLVTGAFNTALSSALDGLETTRPGILEYRLDVEGLFNQLVSDPAAFGLTNASAPAAPGLSIGDTSYDVSQIVPHPDQYLFWDDFHPTAAGHALLAQAALAVVPEPGSVTLFTLTAAGFMLRRRRRAA